MHTHTRSLPQPRHGVRRIDILLLLAPRRLAAVVVEVDELRQPPQQVRVVARHEQHVLGARHGPLPVLREGGKVRREALRVLLDHISQRRDELRVRLEAVAPLARVADRPDGVAQRGAQRVVLVAVLAVEHGAGRPAGAAVYGRRRAFGLAGVKEHTQAGCPSQPVDSRFCGLALASAASARCLRHFYRLSAAEE
ncbi:unnamed protein product [Pelagomonas calceolata]|uniref:Uncharacterized protein n=1 Tax=Pelagomonas calceolata TaxID=35677 RepID=A0A8J2SX70_9STRA|nr:unnamed protein product [Pelagomonas calceolata]